jgi:transposase-like protein
VSRSTRFYAFLPTKELVTYRVMFTHMKKALGDNFPSVFHLDFEAAVLRCIGETFPESHVQGCVVHFKR